MTIEKLTKEEMEHCLEGLCRRVFTIKDQMARKPYEVLLEQTADRYEKLFGHKYVRTFKEYQSDGRWFPEEH